MSKQTRTQIYSFRGSQKPPAVASRDGNPFCSFTAQTSGTPTVAAVSGGSMDLTLDATNEVQVACLYQGDILPFAIDDILKIEFIVKLSSAALNAAITGAIGLASARNSTLNSITNAALFRFAGGTSNSMVIDTRDGTNSQSGIATGQVPGTAYRRLVMDFAGGVKTQAPPLLSKGGKAQVLFYMSDANGYLKRVAQNTNFDMSALSGNLQLFAQIQKTGVAAGGTLSIAEILVEHRLAV
ncbi:MAG: hypothetical protein ACO1RA_02265 [Planctomycetaceae bacterium]